MRNIKKKSIARKIINDYTLAFQEYQKEFDEQYLTKMNLLQPDVQRIIDKLDLNITVTVSDETNFKFYFNILDVVHYNNKYFFNQMTQMLYDALNIVESDRYRAYFRTRNKCIFITEQLSFLFQFSFWSFLITCMIMSLFNYYTNWFTANPLFMWTGVITCFFGLYRMFCYAYKK